MQALLIVALSTLAVCLAGCERSESIGVVGGDAVTVSEYEAYLKLKNVPLNDRPRYERMQEQFIKRSALAEAINESERLDPQMLEAEVEEFRKQLLISRYFESYLNDTVSDEGLQNYYSANVEDFQSEQVRVGHILFRVNPKMDESERQSILTTAHETYSKLNAGEDFAELAKSVSEDRVSAEKGGELGWISKGAVAPEFSDKAFSLNKGEVSEPFLTAFGFHILKVLDEPQVVKKPLESVKGDIRYQLRNKAKQAETDRLLDNIEYSVKTQSEK